MKRLMENEQTRDVRRVVTEGVEYEVRIESYQQVLASRREPVRWRLCIRASDGTTVWQPIDAGGFTSHAAAIGFTRRWLERRHPGAGAAL